MISKASLTGSFILLAASLGQAAAGSTISDKRYWPNEVAPSADWQAGESAHAQQVPKARRSSASQQQPASKTTCTYQGGPKGNLWACR